MPIKTGQQYIDSLRDGRRLFIDGKVVSDVTAYPPLQGVIGTIARLHDDQHDPALQDILTYVSPTSGGRVSTATVQAEYDVDKRHSQRGQLRDPATQDA